MKVGASYYPELLPRGEWRRDLETARSIGLSCLRCGEFAWSAISPAPEEWRTDWITEFLDLAAELDFEVIWCTPSASPPPYLHTRWPDLQAVNSDGRTMPAGIRRNYCPSHEGYRELCAKTAARLGAGIGRHRAVVGWQVDNEIAGDGFTCWCENCREKFHLWLEERYGSLENLNRKWQTDLWSQKYSSWNEIPVPLPLYPAHAPSLKLAYRRFRSENWLGFYKIQADALRGAGAGKVTTNFYNVTWDIPFDLWKWRDGLDSVGASHYLEGDTESRFQLALLNGVRAGRPLWILEQKAGQQVAQNLIGDELARIEEHLVRCAEYGAEYAIYWHLRQHSAGCECEHGAVLRHDGRPGAIAKAVKDAIAGARAIKASPKKSKALLVFSFNQHWANECRPGTGTRWDYRAEIQDNWFAAALKKSIDVSVGPVDAIRNASLAIAPFLQIDEPGMKDAVAALLGRGGILLTTADIGRLDMENNNKRKKPLAFIEGFAEIPEIEFSYLKDGARLGCEANGVSFESSIFAAVPSGRLNADAIGTMKFPDGNTSPVALSFKALNGRVIVVLGALDAKGVGLLLDHVQTGNFNKIQ